MKILSLDFLSASRRSLFDMEVILLMIQSMNRSRDFYLSAKVALRQLINSTQQLILR